jgi:hypothetical protein
MSRTHEEVVSRDSETVLSVRDIGLLTTLFREAHQVCHADDAQGRDRCLANLTRALDAVELRASRPLAALASQ